MRIEATHQFDHPHADVLAWHERPGALVRLTPPGLAAPAGADEGGTRAGRIVGVRLGPPQVPQFLRPTQLVRHTESDGNGFFVDRQIRGPWRTWEHEHRISPAVDATDAADVTTDSTDATDVTDAADVTDATDVATAEDATTIHDSLTIELPRHLERFEPLAASQVRRLLAFRAEQLQDDLAFHARFSGVPRQTIAISGSSGLIGQQLVALLQTGGHTVKRMVREESVGEGGISWDPQAGLLDPADLDGVDIVINLAGRSIATRWTSSARREILRSRVHGSHLIARTIAQMSDGPRTLIQASAVGHYGSQRPGELLTESDPGGDGFLADVVRDWEAATRPAAEAGIRVAHIRTGIVLSDAGGALVPQLPLFLAGVGGRLTKAEAMTPWIALDDIVRVFAHAALTPSVVGPVNGVAPHPVTAREFARTLGAVLRRPALIPVPGFGPKLLLGAEAGRELVQADQWVSAARLEASGFGAAYPELEPALRHILRR